MTRTDYACSGSEDEVTRGILQRVTAKMGQGLLRSILEKTKIAVTRVIPQRKTLGMGQGMRLRLELRYI